MNIHLFVEFVFNIHQQDIECVMLNGLIRQKISTTLQIFS